MLTVRRVAWSLVAAACLLGAVWVIESASDQRYPVAVAGYIIALSVGWVLGLFRLTWPLLAGLTIAVVMMPRMIFNDTYPVSISTTYQTRYLALVCAAILGAALSTPGVSSRERRLVAVPLVLTILGMVLYPPLLLDPTGGWLASGGALFVMATRWRTLRRTAVVAAFAAGAISIVWRLAGFGAQIGVLASGRRPFGYFGNPLIAADAMWFLAATVIALFWRRRLVAAALTVVSVYVVVETGSHTSLMLATVTLIAALLGYYPLAAETRLSEHRILAVIVVGGLLVVAFRLFQSSLGRAGDLNTNTDSVAARSSGLRHGVAGVLTHPAGGGTTSIGRAGLNTYENMFFDCGAHLGWFPLAALVATLVIAWRLGSAAGRTLVVLMVVAGSTGATYYHPAGYILPLIGAGLVTAEARRKMPPRRATRRRGRRPATRRPTPMLARTSTSV